MKVRESARERTKRLLGESERERERERKSEFLFTLFTQTVCDRVLVYVSAIGRKAELSISVLVRY